MSARLVPPLAHGDSRTRVLLHVISSSRPTVKSCADAAEVTRAVAHHHLKVLRGEGLVEWDDGRQGTLRATCRPVPYGGPDAA